MRTKILKYFGMVVVLIIMVNLTSCEVSIESWYDDDDYSEIYYRTTRELCSRTWQETWVQDGEYYTQRLDFYENRTGTDIIRIEHRNGYVTEDRYNFEWRWDNSAQTCIRMVYGPSDISYFENVWHFSAELDDWGEPEYYVNGQKYAQEDWFLAMAMAEEEAGDCIKEGCLPLDEEHIKQAVDREPGPEELPLWQP